MGPEVIVVGLTDEDFKPLEQMRANPVIGDTPIVALSTAWGSAEAAEKKADARTPAHR